jgi:hypothetical protein
MESLATLAELTLGTGCPAVAPSLSGSLRVPRAQGAMGGSPNGQLWFPLLTAFLSQLPSVWAVSMALP